MTAVVPEQDRRTMIPHAYLSDLNKTAMFALAMGAPLGLVRHVTFLLNYINAWLVTRPWFAMSIRSWLPRFFARRCCREGE